VRDNEAGLRTTFQPTIAGGSGLPALRMGCERDRATAAGFTAGGVRCLRAVLRSQVGELPKSQLPAERAQMMAE